MTSPKIRFLPVGNGDMTLVVFDSGRKLLIDVNIRAAADDPDDDTPDVAEELRGYLTRDASGRLFVDALLLSHPDEDHCRGLKRHFHLGKPGDWSKSADKIFIREIWSSPMVFRRASKNHVLCADASAFNTEARRRVQKFRDSYGLVSEGDRILIMGEDEDGKTDDLGAILVRVNEQFTRINGTSDYSMTARLLAPHPKSDDEEDETLRSKNHSSVILNISLYAGGKADACRFLTGGDAEVAIWDRLWDEHANRPHWLEYDILQAPHHCSWHSLSYDSWSEFGEDAEVSQSALKALSQTRPGAVIVASSRAIKDDDVDPPCIRAKREYKAIASDAGGSFKCVGEPENNPATLTFEIGKEGPRLLSKAIGAAIITGTGVIGNQALGHGLAMSASPSMQQGVSNQLGGAMRLLRAHPAIVSASVRSQDATDTYTPIDVELRVEMYQAWMAAGQSPNGVRKIEPLTLLFFSDYPLSAPIPMLRADFDCALAHVIPGRLWGRPIPCIYEGSNSELLLQRGLAGIVDQLVSWLIGAALGTLIDPAQGWEPVRRDDLDDFVIADFDALRAKHSDKGGYAAYRLDYFRSKSNGKFIHYGQLGSVPVPINAKNVGDYFKEQSLGDADQSSFAKGLALVAWPGRDAAGKPFVADKYLPETVATLQDLHDRAALYGCQQALRDALSWLGQCLREQQTSEPVPLVVILAARRPFHLINSDSEVELNPYLLEFSAPDLFPAANETAVRPVGYRDAIAPGLLRALSGLSRKIEPPPYVVVGAGSLGSKLLVHAARAGMAPSHIIDRHHLSPHNAARHALLPILGVLGPQFYGSKADEAVKAIKALGQHATGHDGNVVDILRDPALARTQLHRKNWAIVNSTASLVVREAFAAARPQLELPRVIETTLFGQASFGLVTVEGPKRNPDCGELITEAYEVFRTDKDARKGIFEAQDSLKRIVVGDGCGSLTMTASDARISLLAAPMAEMIQDFQRDGLPPTGRIALAKVTAQGRGLQWHDFNIPNFDRIVAEDGSGWQVSVAARARDKIAADVRRWRTVETGGVVLGRISEAARTFYIVDVLPAPTDSHRSRSEFVLGVKGLRRTLTDYVRSTNGCLYCIGTWHSHLGDFGASTLDKSTARILALGRISPSVMLIHTPVGFRAIAADAAADQKAFTDSNTTDTLETA